MGKRSKNCRDEQGAWEFGGGSMEFGETLEEHVSREVKEEFGVEIKELIPLGVKSVLRENNGVKTHWILFVWAAQVNPHEVIIGDPHATDEIGWFTINNLPSPVHSTVPYEIAQLKAANLGF
jgi:ADP-ribose pyrophosphatase YjhB (NUDIX family)